ncbi:MAG: YceH family protein [Holophagaceae bacterium]|nr:YceH family protein [Holophagaceae bacterium]
MTDSPLNEVECRILGCLMEKQHTTPDYYPLTLYALVAACNQTSNRHPLVAYDEATVSDGLESLRQRRLVWLLNASGSRTVKYEQRLSESLHLAIQETALLCVLMLRGAQTLGELRGRSERIYPFADLVEAEAAMQALLQAEPEPLAMKLPKLPGTKEPRYAHLLAGPVECETLAVVQEEVKARNLPPLAHLESEVQSLRLELAELRAAFESFKAQF